VDRICSTQGDMNKRPKKRPKARWTGDAENERWEILIGGK